MLEALKLAGAALLASVPSVLVASVMMASVATAAWMAAAETAAATGVREVERAVAGLVADEVVVMAVEARAAGKAVELARVRVRAVLARGTATAGVGEVAAISEVEVRAKVAATVASAALATAAVQLATEGGRAAHATAAALVSCPLGRMSPGRRDRARAGPRMAARMRTSLACELVWPPYGSASATDGGRSVCQALRRPDGQSSAASRSRVATRASCPPCAERTARNRSPDCVGSHTNSDRHHGVRPRSRCSE